MNIHEVGRELVKAIIHRKRMALYYSNTPECALCENPRPGTEHIQCPAGCEHWLCLRCKQELDIKKTAMEDQFRAHLREQREALKRDWHERQRWASQN